jgi:peptidoglycan/xylan/chitin deacetylase (PgdA/CDA1 family)
MDGVRTTPQRICRRLARAKGGDIVILHDGAEPARRRDASATIASLKPLINSLRDRGLTFVRLDELVGWPAYAQPRAGGAVLMESIR